MLSLQSKVLLCAATLISCASGVPAEAVRPRDATYAEATHEAKCTAGASGQAVTPLIVDWKPDERGDLEIAMKRGIAAVHYDCHSFRVLSDCSADGRYTFTGITTKQQLLRLENADELNANLPTSGVKLVADLGGNLERGATLDVALAMVGKRMTTREVLDQADLRGNCQEATHFVRGVTVGAFAMETGTKASVRTVASVFGAGASAQSSTHRQIQNQDGKLEACDSATPESSEAPSQCGAFLRLHLLPLGQHAATPDGNVLELESCPNGHVLSEGKCVKEAVARDLAHACNWTAADCQLQCSRGSGLSCRRAAWIYQNAYHVPRDQRRAVDFYKRGCELGSQESCVMLGSVYYFGWGGTPKDFVHAHALYLSACQAGSPSGCRGLGAALYYGIGVSSDRRRAFAAYSRGCDGGEPASCDSVANCLATGRCGVPKDTLRAYAIFNANCSSGYAKSCAHAKKMH